MNLRPIPFKPPMVRAILAGTKTQTRRILKPAPEKTPTGFWHVPWQTGGGVLLDPGATDERIAATARDGVRIEVHDRLWVREAMNLAADPVCYVADGVPVETDGFEQDLWMDRYKRDIVPPIHMPRWASRITLEVTGVRVERLQDISEADAIAEGVERSAPEIDPDLFRDYVRGGDCDTARLSYETLWTSINGPGSWAENPFVVAYTFERIKP